MSAEKEILGSDPTKLFLTRLWSPLIFGGGAILIMGNNWRGLWVLWPFILWAIFLLSLAEVRVEPDSLRYRRLFKWRKVTYDEITRCGAAWPPFMGFLGLRSFVLPWGRLYFVLDGSLYDNPFRQPDSEIIRLVDARVSELGPARSSREPTEASTTATRMRSCLIACGVGALVSFMVLLLFPEQAGFYPSESEWPRWLVIYYRTKEIIFRWPLNLVAFALLAFAAARSRQRSGWVFAFMAGLLLPSLVFGWWN